MKKGYLISILIIACLNIETIYAQGNYRIENFGNLSILLNGNVTGSVEDLGLTYYNPSRLALLDNPNFAISGKAFQINNTTLEKAFGEDKNLKSSDFNSVPGMVAGTFNFKSLPKHYFAYSFISRYRTNTNLNYDTGILEQDVLETMDGPEKFIARVNLDNNLKDEWIGITWATKISENFAVGASTFLSIYEFEGRSGLSYSALESDEQSVTYNNDVYYKQKTYGLFLKAGASWTLKGFEMGVNIHVPYINFRDSATFEYDEVLAGLGSGEDIFTFISLDDLDNNRKTAFGISFGTGIPIGKSKIHLNIEWYNGIGKYHRIQIPDLDGQVDEVLNVNFNEELKPVFNFGIGSEIYISPSLRGFLSFSSDFSAYKSNANLFDIINPYGNDINYRTDYWHFGLGFDFKLNWGSFVLGSTYASSNANFAQPINFPVGGITTIENQVSNLNLKRWRFIIGLEISLPNKNLKLVMDDI